jgi:hypothetical protein
MEKSSGTYWMELVPKLGWQYAEEINVCMNVESKSSTLFRLACSLVTPLNEFTWIPFWLNKG